MANERTEYQDAYTGPTCSARQARVPHDFKMCTRGEVEQPVGGRVAQKNAEKEAHRLPICDEDFVAQVYTSEERGTHRIEPKWRDPRWSDAMRGENCTMYEPSQRDPPNRLNGYGYRTTIVDALRTPCQPLTVPDVHKLRYMHNNYMSQDDWY